MNDIGSELNVLLDDLRKASDKDFSLGLMIGRVKHLCALLPEVPAEAERDEARAKVAAVEDILDALETATAEVEGRPIIDARVVAATLRDALTPKCDLCRTFYGGGSIPHHDLELGCAPSCPCQPTHDCTALAATPEDER